jgi:protocatechuate 3,4-dioxygenase beta subunit
VKNVPGYQPASQKVDLKKSPVIRLKKGVRLEGVVLDQATGNPIPNATVNAWPVGNLNGSTIPVETRADANGKFLFTSMAESSYNLRVNDGECPATSAIGGQSNPVTLRVKLYSWSKLKP